MVSVRSGIAIAAVALSAVGIVLAGIGWDDDGPGGRTGSDDGGIGTGVVDGGSAVQVESLVLSNGLRAVAIPIAKADETVLMVWYGVGAADDPPDKPGLAHYVEHTTFSALGTHESAGDTRGAHRPDRKKPQPEAFTAHDYTAYYQVTSKERLDAALRLEADRMANLQIDEAAVNAERQAVLDEREHDADGDPEALLEEGLRAALFGNGPYGRPIVGREADTARVSSADVRAFLDRWYSPGNAILAVAGDVDVVGLRNAVEAHFGQISSSSMIPKRERPTPPVPAGRTVLLGSNSGSQVLWGRTCLAQSSKTADRREVSSLQVLARILAYHDDGRLWRSLVADRRIAEEVVVEYDPDAVGNTVFAIYAMLAPEADLATFQAIIENELADIASRGVSAEEVAEAREAAVADMSDAWRDPLDAASMVGSVLATGGTLADVEEWPRLASGIEPEEVRNAAREVLARNNCATGTLRASEE